MDVGVLLLAIHVVTFVQRRLTYIPKSNVLYLE